MECERNVRDLKSNEKFNGIKKRSTDSTLFIQFFWKVIKIMNNEFEPPQTTHLKLKTVVFENVKSTFTHVK